MLHILLAPLGIELTCETDCRLIDLLDDVEDTRVLASVPLSCRGARCGVCRVRILRGQAATVAPQEAELCTLRALGAAPEERLACQLHLRAEAGCTVELAFHTLTTLGPG